MLKETGQFAYNQLTVSQVSHWLNLD